MCTITHTKADRTWRQSETTVWCVLRSDPSLSPPQYGRPPLLSVASYSVPLKPVKHQKLSFSRCGVIMQPLKRVISLLVCMCLHIVGVGFVSFWGLYERVCVCMCVWCIFEIVCVCVCVCVRVCVCLRENGSYWIDPHRRHWTQCCN